MDTTLSFLVPCGIIAVASLPLILGLVPPNRMYGVRTRETLVDRELWLRSNRFAGWAFLIAAGASTAMYGLAPEHASGRSLVGLAMLIGPLLGAMLVTRLYVRQSGPDGER